MGINNFWVLTVEEMKIADSIVEKSGLAEKTVPEFTIINLNDYLKLFNSEERDLINYYLKINPKEINYKLPYIGFKDTPKDLVVIKNQKLTLDGHSTLLSNQYLPQNVFSAFENLVQAMGQDINKRVLIEWGYRSPACQVHNFFKFFKHYNFDFQKTISRVCFPDYSEHVCVRKQAIDFITKDGIDDEFDKTEEYKWLMKNANKFGFFESYPKDNNLGMMYEPWHWHYET